MNTASSSDGVIQRFFNLYVASALPLPQLIHAHVVDDRLLRERGRFVGIAGPITAYCHIQQQEEVMVVDSLLAIEGPADLGEVGGQHPEGGPDALPVWDVYARFHAA
jgi:hypothetical protein